MPYSKSTLRLAGLSLDFSRDGERFDRLRGISCIEWLAEPKGLGLFSLPAGRQGLTVHFDRLSVLSLPKEVALRLRAQPDTLAPSNGSTLHLAYGRRGLTLSLLTEHGWFITN